MIKNTPSTSQLGRWMLRAAAVALVVLGAAGCASYNDYSAFVQDPKPLVTSTAYHLAPPDVITISSKVVKEANGHNEQIRPDGMITMPMIGSVFVAGLTCDQASALLESKYKDYYQVQKGDFSLYVSQFNSKKIYVFGEVSYAGAYEYDGTNTILGTLAKAQPTRLADDYRVHVLRPNKDGELIRRMTIDPSDMIHKGHTNLDSVLEEGDIVFVPAGPLAEVGLFLQQILLPIQPAMATVQTPAKFYGVTTGVPYRGGGAQ